MIKPIVTAVAVAMAMVGCANTAAFKQGAATAAARSDALAAQAQAHFSAAGQAPIVLPLSGLPYIGNGNSVVRPGRQLPPEFSKKVWFNQGDVTASGLAALLTEELGLHVKLTVPKPQKGQSLKDFAALHPVQTADLGTIPREHLARWLDQASAQMGVDWQYSDNTVTLGSVWTRSYVLDMSSGSNTDVSMMDKTAQTRTGGGTGNTGMSGNFQSELRSGSQIKLDDWTDAVAAISQIAGGSDNVVSAPALGIVMVTCSLACHRQVAALVGQMNARATTSVMLRVETVNVTTTANGEDGINWAAVYQSVRAAGHNYALSFASPLSLTSTADGGFGVNILSTAQGNAGQWDGTGAMVQALSAAGDVVTRTPYDMLAPNGHTTTINVTDQQTITASTTVVPTGVSGTPVYTQNPGYITYGQVIKVTPIVLSGGRIDLRLGLDDSSLTNLQKAVAPGDIDKATLGSFVIQSEPVLTPGQTLILSGFKRETHSYTGQGLLPGQHLGSETGSRAVTETVILVTPYLLPSSSTVAQDQ